VLLSTRKDTRVYCNRILVSGLVCNKEFTTVKALKDHLQSSSHDDDSIDIEVDRLIAFHNSDLKAEREDNRVYCDYTMRGSMMLCIRTTRQNLDCGNIAHNMPPRIPCRRNAISPCLTVKSARTRVTEPIYMPDIRKDLFTTDTDFTAKDYDSEVEP